MSNFIEIDEAEQILAIKSKGDGPDMSKKTIQDRKPNFRDKEGKLFLVRCYNCDKEHGTENYTPSVSSGTCAWCGWSEKKQGA